MWKSLRELPLTILHVTSEGLERSVSAMFSALRGGEDDEADIQRRRPWWSWIWLLPALAIYWLVRGALWALTFPVRVWFLPAAQRNCFLRGLPAAMLALAAIVLVATHRFYLDSFVQRYATKTFHHLSGDDASKAILYANRLVANPRNPLRENTYLYGLAHANAMNTEVASATLKEIAPDGEIGFAPAHQFRALELARQLDSNPSEELLDNLQWHLEKSGARDQEQVLLLWSRLHLARGELDQAATALDQAGSLNPAHYFALAELEENRDETNASKRALEKAVYAFSSRLNESPNDKWTRLRLAVALTKLKRLQDAERILQAGMQIHREPDMQRALSSFYLLRFDDEDQASFVQRLAFLMRAMTVDLNDPAIYVRLARLFDPELPSERKKEIQSELEQLLASGTNPSVVHFALGYLAALEPESRSQAGWHLGQACTLQPPIAIAYNNLALILANTDPPRLDEAELLARQAVAGSIQESAFYVTLGRILNAKQEWSAAIATLTPALGTYPQSPELLNTLAVACDALGDHATAAAHRESAEQIRAAAVAANSANSDP